MPGQRAPPFRVKRQECFADIDQPAPHGLAQHLPVSTPPVSRSVLDDPRNHRVEVNVCDELPEVILVFDTSRSIAALPKRPEDSVPTIEALGELLVNRPHRSRQRHLAHPHCEVVDHDILWGTVDRELPVLLDRLEKVLAQVSPERS
jgi:hypothetical protein